MSKSHYVSGQAIGKGKLEFRERDCRLGGLNQLDVEQIYVISQAPVERRITTSKPAMSKVRSLIGTADTPSARKRLTSFD